MISDENKIKADLSKLHSEVNQFRNQEFWVCSFAVALFGGTVRFLPGKPVLALGVTVVLTALYLWHYTLVATRSRLTTYLRVTELSPWEIHYRKFADEMRHPSQGIAAITTFVSIGFLIPIVSGGEALWTKYNECGSLSIRDLDLWAYITPTIAYEIIVIMNGFRNSKDKLARCQTEWKKVIESQLNSKN